MERDLPLRVAFVAACAVVSSTAESCQAFGATPQGYEPKVRFGPAYQLTIVPQCVVEAALRVVGRGQVDAQERDVVAIALVVAEQQHLLGQGRGFVEALEALQTDDQVESGLHLEVARAERLGQIQR